MTNTEYFYQTAADYRKSLREIWRTYDATVARLKPYEGSEGHKADMDKAAATRQQQIKDLQRTTLDTFGRIVNRMREAATSRSMTPPTADELALLQALKMREKISRDELQQARRTLKDSPVSLAVLDEICDKMGYHGLQGGALSTSGILQHIDNLQDAARRICSLDKPDSRPEMVRAASPYNTEYVGPSALYAFKVDRDVKDAAEAMELYGDVSDLASFEAAVN